MIEPTVIQFTIKLTFLLCENCGVPMIAPFDLKLPFGQSFADQVLRQGIGFVAPRKVGDKVVCEVCFKHGLVK